MNEQAGMSAPMATPMTTKYAGFWVRFVAVMVDALVATIPILLVRFLITIILLPAGVRTAAILGGIVEIVLYWAYFVLMTYYCGATLGKMLVGIQVRSEKGDKLGFWQVVLRETVGKLLSSIIIDVGYMMAGWTKRKRGLHDMIATTVVAYKDPSKPNTAGLVIGIIIACVLPAVAIIGILSSIVLVSLSDARQKAGDAKVIAMLNEARLGIEEYYDANGQTYTTANSCSSGVFASNLVASAISSISSSMPVCLAHGQSYAVSASLTAAGQSYCVDSTGFGGAGTASDDGKASMCQKAPSAENL